MNLDELAFKDLLENLNLIRYKNLDEDELMGLAVICSRVVNQANDEIYRRLCEEEVEEWKR